MQKIEKITFPEGLERLGDCSFTRCDKITEVSLPASIKSIGNAPFHDCTRLVNINISANNAEYQTEDGILYNKKRTLLVQYPTAKANVSYKAPDMLQKIGAYAFFQNTNLEEVELPSVLRSINTFAFGFCRSLKKIICKSASPEDITLELQAFFMGGGNESCTLYVPKGSLAKYKKNEEWTCAFGKNIKELP